MRVIGRELLLKAIGKHAAAAGGLRAWLVEAEEADWSCPQDLRERYPSASFLGDDLVVFNIKGNKYRLLVQIDYGSRVLAVQQFGTHAEYSKWKL